MKNFTIGYVVCVHFVAGWLFKDSDENWYVTAALPLIRLTLMHPLTAWAAVSARMALPRQRATDRR